MKQEHTDINPKHYDGIVNGRPVQAVDIIEGFWVDDAHLSQAGKYLLRAGKKPGNSYLSDVGKCLWWCAKAIIFHGGVIELPEAPKTRTAHTSKKAKALAKAHKR